MIKTINHNNKEKCNCKKNDRKCLIQCHINKLKQDKQSNLYKKNYNNIKIGFPVNLGCI